MSVTKVDDETNDKLYSENNCGFGPDIAHIDIEECSCFCELNCSFYYS